MIRTKTLIGRLLVGLVALVALGLAWSGWPTPGPPTPGPQHQPLHDYFPYTNFTPPQPCTALSAVSCLQPGLSSATAKPHSALQQQRLFAQPQPQRQPYSVCCTVVNVRSPLNAYNTILHEHNTDANTHRLYNSSIEYTAEFGAACSTCTVHQCSSIAKTIPMGEVHCCAASGWGCAQNLTALLCCVMAMTRPSTTCNAFKQLLAHSPRSVSETRGAPRRRLCSLHTSHLAVWLAHTLSTGSGAGTH